jgi:hypothetical protein
MNLGGLTINSEAEADAREIRAAAGSTFPLRMIFCVFLDRTK